MIELNDIEQMAYLFGIHFSTTVAGNAATIFEFTEFGVKVIFNETTLTGTSYRKWRVVNIKPDDILEEKRMEVIWELMKSGYMHYLRTEIPRTFKELIISKGWDKKIINKRLELYGDDPKYNYWRELNKWALKESSTYVLSVDPGFFDFLSEEKS